MKESKYKYLLKNIGFFLISVVSTKLIGYILLPIFTAYLTPEEYGIADIMISTYNLLYPIIMLGMYDAVLRYCMDEETDKQLSFTTGGIVLIISSIASLVIIPIIGRGKDYRPYAFYIPILAFITNSIKLQIGICKATDKTQLVAIQNIVYGITLWLSAIVLVKYLDLGITGYLTSYTLADLMSLIYLGNSLKATRYIKKKIEWLQFKLEAIRMLKYGIPLIADDFAWWIMELSDRYMVAYWHGNALNGLYSVASKIPAIVRTIVGAFIQAWQMSAISEFGEKGSKEFYNTIYRSYCVVCYMSTSVIIIASQLLAKILFSAEFYPAWKFVPLLLIVAAISSQEAYWATFYLAEQKALKFLSSSYIGAGVNIVLNILLIPRFQVTGATIATALSYFIVYIQRVIDLRKRMQLDALLFKNLSAIVLLCVQAYLYVYFEDNFAYTYGSSFIILLMIAALFAKEIRELFKQLIKLVKKFKG